MEQAQAAFDDRPDAQARQAEVDQLRPGVDAVRQSLAKAQAEREQHKRDALSRTNRLGAIVTARFSWEGRLKNAEHQHAQLDTRDKSLTEERAALDARPADIANK